LLASSALISTDARGRAKVRLENGRREGSVSVFRRLARRLGVSGDELLPDERGFAKEEF
jgi:transcriptional regulator with XRE-family HTH domain